MSGLFIDYFGFYGEEGLVREVNCLFIRKFLLKHAEEFLVDKFDDFSWLWKEETGLFYRFI